MAARFRILSVGILLFLLLGLGALPGPGRPGGAKCHLYHTLHSDDQGEERRVR